LVTGFAGDAWFVDVQSAISQNQTSYRGHAEGVFYSCNYEGQSATYTRYKNNDFFTNPEIELFLPERETMTRKSEVLFVHRITCEGDGKPSQRRVIYPFVTKNIRESAWYLFEGGVFSLTTR
jgi:hypothetical protein